MFSHNVSRQLTTDTHRYTQMNTDKGNMMIRHSRAGGSPVVCSKRLHISLDSRLRGNDSEADVLIGVDLCELPGAVVTDLV